MSSSLIAVLVAGVPTFAVGYLLQLLRWVRVVDRERYRPGTVATFYRRWAFPASSSAVAVRHNRSISSTVLKAPFTVGSRLAESRSEPSATYRPDRKNRKTAKPVSFSVVMAVILTLALVSRSDYVVYAFSCAYAFFFPWSMPLRGRPRPLTWSRQLRAVALGAIGLAIAAGSLVFVVHHRLLVASAELLLVPVFVSVANRVTRIFFRSGDVHEEGRAVELLGQVHPTVVTIFGSAGDPSTTFLVWSLLGQRSNVLRTDAECWNRVDLARFINESLVFDTRVVLIDLAGDRLGEIARETEWCVPQVGVVVASGPDRLEYLKTPERAQGEVLAGLCRAPTVIINTDLPEWASHAQSLRTDGVTVCRAGSSRDTDASVVRFELHWSVSYGGRHLVDLPPIDGATPASLACAVGAAVALGVRPDDLPTLLPAIPGVPVSATVTVSPSGLQIMIALSVQNVAGARRLLDQISTADVSGRRVVVTPGFVELGPQQTVENYRLGALIAMAGAELVAVARTNAEPLLDGYGQRARRFDSRQRATVWVRENLGAHDVVLYLGEIGDHYP